MPKYEEYNGWKNYPTFALYSHYDDGDQAQEDLESIGRNRPDANLAELLERYLTGHRDAELIGASFQGKRYVATRELLVDLLSYQLDSRNWDCILLTVQNDARASNHGTLDDFDQKIVAVLQSFGQYTADPENGLSTQANEAKLWFLKMLENRLPYILDTVPPDATLSMVAIAKGFVEESWSVIDWQEIANHFNS